METAGTGGRSTSTPALLAGGNPQIAKAGGAPPPPGGTSKEARWINVREDDLDEAQLEAWIRQAAALPGWATSDIRA